MVPENVPNPTSINDFDFPANRRGGTIAGATLASPMAIGIPAGHKQSPIILDMATEFSVDPDNTRATLKQLGLQAAVVALGGIMAGIYSDPDILPSTSPWEANQGACLIVMDPSKFLPDDGAAMGTFVAKASALAPLPGLERAELPGTDQARRIAYGEEHGICIQVRFLIQTPPRALHGSEQWDFAAATPGLVAGTGG